MRKGKGELTYFQLKKDNELTHNELNKVKHELHAMTVAHNKLLSGKTKEE